MTDDVPWHPSRVQDSRRLKTRLLPQIRRATQVQTVICTRDHMAELKFARVTDSMKPVVVFMTISKLYTFLEPFLGFL